jgi:hypothetical protein
VCLGRGRPWRLQSATLRSTSAENACSPFGVCLLATLASFSFAWYNDLVGAMSRSCHIAVKTVRKAACKNMEPCSTNRKEFLPQRVSASHHYSDAACTSTWVWVLQSCIVLTRSVTMRVNNRGFRHLSIEVSQQSHCLRCLLPPMTNVQHQHLLCALNILITGHGPAHWKLMNINCPVIDDQFRYDTTVAPMTCILRRLR